MSEDHSSVPEIDQRLFDAARAGDVATLTTLLDEHPSKLDVREPPYAMSLLHLAAQHPEVVELLLARGMDPNIHDSGDNTTPMHWAAAAGELDAVRRLADAGGDVVGKGDDHELEVIGWASCWDGCDDAAHRAVASFLVDRGARHHIFSAIAFDLGDEVRRIVGRDPSSLNRRMSRNENNQLPLHFAVRTNHLAMVALLIELGADPLGIDATGDTFAMYARRADVDRPAFERVAQLTRAEVDSAMRGHRPPMFTSMDLLAAIVRRDWSLAERIATDDASLIAGQDSKLLHQLAKRGDREAVTWLLVHGANPNARALHFDATVTALHLAILANHEHVVRVLLDAGGDPSIRDSKHDGDAVDWADFFQRDAIVGLLSS